MFGQEPNRPFHNFCAAWSITVCGSETSIADFQALNCERAGRAEFSYKRKT